MMMGYAYQKGLLPLTAKAIEQAIEVNGVAVKMNTQAFQLGRLAAIDPAQLVAMMKDHDERTAVKTLDEMSLDEIITHRSALLKDCQNARLATRYRDLVIQVRHAAIDHGLGDELPRAVAINYARLLAYKDSMKSPDYIPTATLKSSSASSSMAISRSASTWRHRCSVKARIRWGGRKSARSAPG